MKKKKADDTLTIWLFLAGAVLLGLIIKLIIDKLF